MAASIEIQIANRTDRRDKNSKPPPPSRNLFFKYKTESHFIYRAALQIFCSRNDPKTNVRRSVDNLDIQGRDPGQGEEETEGTDEGEEARTSEEAKGSPTGPPPPPLSPLQRARASQAAGGNASAETESPKNPQPLATISIQDLTSIQLRRTGTKMNATKTFSAPPPRSVSMTNGKLATHIHTYIHITLFRIRGGLGLRGVFYGIEKSCAISRWYSIGILYH